MSQLTSFCTAPDTCLPRSADIVWSVTRRARQALHDVHGSVPCHRRAPFGDADRRARRPREVCEGVGCVDLFMEVWIPAHRAMHARFRFCEPVPSAALAYLTSSARSQLAELNRQSRVARGGVARPQRRDGTVGRVAASYDDPWLADLFRFLLGYAAAPGRQTGTWPLDALTCRKNIWDGGGRVPGTGAAREELRADVESCLRVVREVAGAGWLHDCLLLPMANRGGPATVPADDCLPPEPDATASDDRLTEGATAVLRDLLDRTAAGAGTGAALCAAVEAWLGEAPPPAAWVATRRNDIALRRLAKRLVSYLVHEGEAA
ncbi:hypothetical protein STENM223S_03583 [Streptomyces tendae]